MALRDASAVVILYSITSRASFNETMSAFSRLWPRKVAVLIGTKIDLKSERQVPREEGEVVAKRWGCEFAEVSAKHRLNVYEVTFDVVRELLKRKAEMREREAKTIVSNAERMPAERKFGHSVAIVRKRLGKEGIRVKDGKFVTM